MPYLPNTTVEVVQIELILLSMYAIPTAMEYAVSAIQILTHLTPTCADVERIRNELHSVDVPTLADRTRVAEHNKLADLFILDLDAEIDACLHNMVQDDKSGLLRWRIDQLCRTARAASEARAYHHRMVLETTP
jgi:hypothetical protein